MKFKKQLFRAAMCGAVLSLASGVAGAQQSAEAGPPQQILVKWKPKSLTMADTTVSAARALSDASARFGTQLESKRTIVGFEVLKLRTRVSEADLQEMVATLSADPAVELAEVDALMQTQFTPNDAQYNQQWHYFEAAGGLNLPTAWDLSTGAGVRVGVIDTGYRPHADLAANLVRTASGAVAGYDFISDSFVANDGGGRDNNAIPGDFAAAGACAAGSRASNSSWHGTHVSGTVAAVTNNGTGVAGVAFGAKVLPLRALGRCGGLTSDIAAAIVWGSGGAVAGLPANPFPAKVLNLSLGGTGACGATTQNAINSARSRGTVVVVAAGNSNRNASNATPANCAGVVTVAAVGRNGGKASYSNFGANVDVAAPGGSAGTGNGVLSTLNAGATTPGADALAFYQGTSMATPHVAGTVALMLSRNPALTPTQVESLLRSSARAFPATCSQCGTGIVNARAAVVAAGP